MAYKNHRNLIAWQKAFALSCHIYVITKAFPREELFGLSSQMQRATVSIPSNIAEGHGRDSENEFDHFLKIASGSLAELDTQLEISLYNNYIDKAVFNNVQDMIEEILKLIYGLRKSLKTKN